MPKVLITGASGFLGGRTAAHFAELDHFSVRATSRSTKKANALNQMGCEFHAGDLLDESFVKSLVHGIDTIVHCAALSSPYGVRSAFESANIRATETSLNQAQKAGVSKFIFISTPNIYVDLKPKYNIKESDPLPNKPVNRYAETKLIAEKLVLANNSESFQTLALRPRAIIGAEDTVIFPRVLNAYEKGKLKIVGRGDNLCDLTCARNVVEAIHCAMHANVPLGGRVNRGQYAKADDEGYHFNMDGKNLIRLTQKHLDQFVQKMESHTGRKISEYDYHVTHQTSRYGNEFFQRNFNINPLTIIETLPMHGNCIAASIPLGLEKLINTEKSTKNMSVSILGTGAGLTLGGMSIRF